MIDTIYQVHSRSWYGKSECIRDLGFKSLPRPSCSFWFWPAPCVAWKREGQWWDSRDVRRSLSTLSHTIFLHVEKHREIPVNDQLLEFRCRVIAYYHMFILDHLASLSGCCRSWEVCCDTATCPWYTAAQPAQPSHQWNLINLNWLLDCSCACWVVHKNPWFLLSLSSGWSSPIVSHLPHSPKQGYSKQPAARVRVILNLYIQIRE